jgi:hypothetical protein
LLASLLALLASALSSEWQATASYITNHSCFVYKSSVAIFTSSHLVAKQEKYDEEMAAEFCPQSISFILVGFFNVPYIYNIGLTVLLTSIILSTYYLFIYQFT